jgi:hypothetical protein
MASGKATGEFSLKSITVAIIPGPAGSLLNQVNWEGMGTGLGATFLRATSEAAAGTGLSASIGHHIWTMATLTTASVKVPTRV